MIPARRNCRARSRTRIGYNTPFIDSSFEVGIEPFARGAESHLGDRGVGCCGGDSAVSEPSRAPKMQTMQQCTGHWNPFAGRRPALGTGVPGRRPARPALGTGVPAEGPHWPALGTGVPAEGRHWARECPSVGRHGLHWARECRPKAGTGRTGAGRRPALACTGGTSECRAAGRRPALAGPKARHCGARSVRAAQ